MNNYKSGKNSEQSAEKMLLGGTTLSVPHRRRSRSEYVFCEMNSPSAQMDGSFERTDFFSAQRPTDAEWIQHKDQLKTSDDVRKASTSCVGRAITYGNTMKAMAPRTEDVPQHLRVTDDIGKVEIPEETQDNEVSIEDVMELVIEKYPNILDIRVPPQQSQFPSTQLPETQAITKEIDGNLSNSEHIDKGVADTGNQMRSGLHWVDEAVKMVDQMGHDNGKASCQEITCGDLLKELQKDPISQDKVCYGTAKSLEELAKKHTEFETGFHGVFTDMRFEILKTEPQKLLDFHTTPLRKGSFGEIRKCQFSADLVFVSKRVTRNFRMEEAIFTNQHDNPNIVKSFALLLKDGIPEIIMEYAGQSLSGLLNEVKSLPETTIRALTFQLCRGLAFLESRFIIHCDIKPENIFVMPNESGNYDLKIGDFGSAQSSKAPLEVTPCTPEYMSPEMFHFLHGKLSYTLQPKTDVFSAGLVVGFMYRGENLLIKYIKAVNPEIKDVTSLRQHLIRQVFLHADIVDNLIPEAASLKQRTIMHGMLQIDGTKRYFAEETLNVMIGKLRNKKQKKRVFRGGVRHSRITVKLFHKKQMFSVCGSISHWSTDLQSVII
ncbi:uncharacterized protein LOC125679339 isoform X3 [Ostrea edulis]|uniref:uncharacterized protein LOC125679339 isoform X3 n=1 Tax=Ostrea edulis TaxID=37623 RepID=UPI0024AED20D|nr:uncharacterized protein LOC125679339 isoform X3 [Ostrea edulis]